MKKLHQIALLCASLLIISVSVFAEPFNKSFVLNKGGLNTKFSHFALGEGETPDCQNVYFGEDGSIKKRSGYVHSLSVSGSEQITGVYFYDRQSSTDQIIVTAESKAFYGESYENTTLTELTLNGSCAVSGTNLFDFATLDDTCLFTNDDDIPMWLTGTGHVFAADVPTGLTKAKWVAAFKNRFFYGNVVVSGTEFPSRIYWCDISDINTWSGTSWINVNAGDGEEITGMESLGDRLVVYKKTRIYSIVGTGDDTVPFIVVQTPASIGAISGYSIDNIEGNHVFLAHDGLYAFDGSYTFKLSTKIDPTIAGYATNMLPWASGTAYEKENQYWLLFDSGSDSKNDTAIIFDWSNKSFTRYSNINGSYITSPLVSGTEKLYIGGYTSQVYLGDTGQNDDGSAISAYYYTKWFDMDVLTKSKQLRHLYVYLEDVGNYNLNVGYNYDFSDGVWKQKDMNMSGGGDLVGSCFVGTAVVGSSGGIRRRWDLTSQGAVFRFKFENNNADETFNVRGFAVSGEVRSLR